MTQMARRSKINTTRAEDSGSSSFNPDSTELPSTAAIKKRTRSRSNQANHAPPKRSRKEASRHSFLLSSSDTLKCQWRDHPALPPSRQHSISYHRPILLDDPIAQLALLSWFERVSATRDMPWRQKWIDPAVWERDQTGDGQVLREALKRRAYQVWISEIMLQQTRVETVRAYYQAWHARWPRIEDLAAASPSDVLGAWRGLGYYSRATRIHTAAKQIVSDPAMDGLLPELPAELESKVPGVGRYTAGAISSIVFGHAVPLLDGNVARVLCRQLALHANLKNKATTDLLWEAADILIKTVSTNVLNREGVQFDGLEPPRSQAPSLWNQALMELGSTVCKPTEPDCGNCPIQGTCMAYAEGETLALKTNPLSKRDGSISDEKITDIEDLCSLCEPLSFVPGEFDSTTSGSASVPSRASKLETKKTLKQSTLQFRGVKLQKSFASKESTDIENKRRREVNSVKVVENYLGLFPLKVAKKPSRQEECVVCIIERLDTEEPNWFIQQRPEHGLLAGLWQFPSLTIFSDQLKGKECDKPDESSEEDQSGSEVSSGSRTRKNRVTNRKAKAKDLGVSTTISKVEQKRLAVEFASASLQASDPKTLDRVPWSVRHVKDAGDVTHLFSHIRLVMHVHIFQASQAKPDRSGTSLEPVVVTKEVMANYRKQCHVQAQKWATGAEVGGENMGVGMMKCWAMAHKEDL
jgi:A/G-specific adenine glycosylase